ncbi:MAG TPA: DUF1015 domain-containing protein [Candidatus Woesebacteria bacterium]|nr:DUF1015 domain-containing protein [Candidatus Woesebacteria bacterium]HPJ17320.1 DUF1015 domain-containing protein [Candidatus Woesebacteria bacterium]
MKIFNQIGVGVPKILLPKEGVNLNKWAVVACDQYTSEPEYWKDVENYVGEEPSTLKITLPEVYLESENKQERIEKINQTMKDYLDGGVLEEKVEGFVVVERTFSNGKIRKGLIVALDLEKYEYTKGSKTLIRATEGTVESRIPPRLEIRKNALVELPHIMVLIDDPLKKVIEGVKKEEVVYETELMMDGGKIKGWKISNEEEIERIANELEKLISNDGFLFAMGDGNHSLATAKTHWNNLKNQLSEEEKVTSPARFALVELVNIHDDGLEFEPIHRLVYKVDSEKLIGFIEGEGEEIEVITKSERKMVRIKNSGSNLLVGNLQILLDEYLKINPETKIDYIHGDETVEKLAKEMNGVGFILPVMKKEELFPTVEKDGALPRKTFSMGEAQEKRFYLESRKIIP